MASLVINFVILHDISSYLVMQLKIIATERPFVWEVGLNRYLAKYWFDMYFFDRVFP